MIHKIAPHIYYPEFRSAQPAESDFVCIFNGNSIFLIKDEEKKLFLPTFANLEKKFGGNFSLKCFADQAEYLFSIDSTAFFRLDILALSLTALPAEDFHSPMVFRTFQPEYLAFAGITACQINRFRLDRRFCGRCGHAMTPSTTERAMICPACGMIEYPKISPAIITAIVDGDRILLTQYARAASTYRHWALVAGYVEVGETFKGAVRREVMEEVGLKVKDIIYYKSQPWSFSDSDMIGFFARLDGEDTITLQESELATAQWFTRDTVPSLPSHISIGQEMIELFRQGKDPFSI